MKALLPARPERSCPASRHLALQHLGQQVEQQVEVVGVHRPEVVEAERLEEPTGHERVLRARLSDARYFYNADVKVPMEAWVEKLKGVLFQAKLGSMHEKVTRVQTVAGWLADKVNPDLKAKATRAAWLCKADLVSQVVGEFAKLLRIGVGPDWIRQHGQAQLLRRVFLLAPYAISPARPIVLAM